MKRNSGHSRTILRCVPIALVAFSAVLSGCGDSDSHATKEEEKTFRDRDPSHMHGIPKDFKFPPGAGPGGGGPGGPGGPPPGALKQPPTDGK